MEIAIFILVLFVLGVIGCINTRKELISLNNKVDYANSAVEVIYSQRYDLIPSLVAIVKQYTQHENKLLEKLVELRIRGRVSKINDKERNDINIQIDYALRSFKAIVRNYPDLKVNDRFIRVQAAFYEYEAEVADVRRNYNAAVMFYNEVVEAFPTNIIAWHMKYKRKDMMETVPIERRSSNNATRSPK